MKICPYCQIEFETRRSRQICCGAEICKDKHNVKLNKKFRAKNPDYMNNYMKKYRKKHYNNSKKFKWKIKGLTWQIKNDFFMKKYDKSMKYNKKKGKCPDCGHSMSGWNRKPICNACNMKKKEIPKNIIDIFRLSEKL